MRVPALASLTFIVFAAPALTTPDRLVQAVAATQTAAVSGIVFADTDGDAVQDADERGLAGWRVILEGETLESEILERETETDRSGAYSFQRIPQGDYAIVLPCEGQPSLWVGSNESGVTIGEGADYHDDIDFPVRPVESPLGLDSEIAGRFVWDENRDAIPQPSEPGPEGWRVTAYLVGGQCLPAKHQSRTTSTGAGGSFRFEGVVAGLYEITTDGLPRNSDHFEYIQDTPGATGRGPDGWEYFDGSSMVEAPSNGVGKIEIGLLKVMGNGSISGILYRDLNLDGDRDPGELEIAGSTMVGLMYRTPKGHALMGLLTTRAFYEFTGLAAGDFLVGALLGGKPVNPPGGADGVPDFPVTLREGEHRTGVDFGFEPVPEESLPETWEPTVVSPPLEGTRVAPLPPVSPPVTGSGADGSDSTALVALLIALGSIGVAGGALLARRRAARG